MEPGSKYEFIVNLKIAKALDINFPITLRARTYEVIEQTAMSPRGSKLTTPLPWSTSAVEGPTDIDHLLVEFSLAPERNSVGRLLYVRRGAGPDPLRTITG